MDQFEILIVDDEPVNIKVLAEALKGSYRVRFATNGRDAIKIARGENSPDLILLDVIMPGMDGYEVCRELKADDRTKNIPIIFITAMNQGENELKGLEAGAVDYVVKPFSLPLVQIRVQTQLELRRQRDLVEKLSVIDALTGIPNRRYMDQFLDMEWRRCIRRQSPLSIVLLDLDHFQRFNDRHGARTGDACLQQVAKALTGITRRPAEFVARYQAAQFAAVLPESEGEGTEVLAEMMRQRIESLDITQGPSILGITVSVGAATMVPQRDSSPQVLLDVAERLLFEAKAAGRNCSRSLNIT